MVEFDKKRVYRNQGVRVGEIEPETGRIVPKFYRKIGVIRAICDGIGTAMVVKNIFSSLNRDFL